MKKLKNRSKTGEKHYSCGTTVNLKNKSKPGEQQ
jgi:hypothetical protein